MKAESVLCVESENVKRSLLTTGFQSVCFQGSSLLVPSDQRAGSFLSGSCRLNTVWFWLWLLFLKFQHCMEGLCSSWF